MDIYITNLETGSRLQFPMLPEKIKLSIGNQFHNYQFIHIGEVKIPSGQALDGFSWSGMLPGPIRRNAPYVRGNSNPKQVISFFKGCKAVKGKPKKLKLLITETSINSNVYLDTFSGDFTGGQGDFNYQINLLQAKDVLIYASGNTSETNNSNSDSRSSPPASDTHTVKKGDTLWDIAQKLMGDGSRYPELYEANKSIIDSRNQQADMPKYTIYPGQVFTIPN